MKLSFLSALYMRYPLEKAFEAAARQGYDGVEVWGGRPHAYGPDVDERRAEEIRGYAEKYNLEIPMFCAELLSYPYNIASTDAKERKETTEYLKQSLDAAARIGAPGMLITVGHAGYGTNRKDNFRNIVGVMKELAEHAQKREVDIVVEPLTVQESNTIVFLDDVLELFDAVGSDRVKSMLDTVMPMTNWETYTEYFEKLGVGRKLAYIHLEDSSGVDQYHKPIGTGILDFDEIFALIRKYGYDGWISLELISSYIREPEMASGMEIRKVRRFMNEC